MNPVLERYGLVDVPYLLTVCTIEPRKNLVGLIQAYSRLSDELRHRHPLVITGHKGWLTEAIEQAMEPLQREGSLRWLGYVPAADLPIIYNGAYAFAYPSFYEGFGLPLIEAMASGLPILTSDRAAMPEIVGDVALKIDPEDIEDITENLRRILLDDEFRQFAHVEGLAHSKQFTWEKCVDKTVEVYRKALV
jgi:alpha-1,3-rhamnosyl/mannosyltransferase